MSVVGIWGQPFIDLEPLLDVSGFAAMHEEICLGLAQVQVSYTGGSHRSLGITPPSLPPDPHVDYGEALATLTPAQQETFRSLADPEDEEADDDDSLRAEDYGEDRERPLSFRQMLYLKYRFGVYFPWKVYYELLPNRWWSDKSDGAGKSFTDEARAVFPRTVAFVESLPFREIGWVKILGLESNDHGTVHLDGDPSTKRTVDHFVSFCPAGDKRLFLWDEAEQRKRYAPSRAYWFNDSDYHGIEADPCFRYSIRVDGRFDHEFVARLLERYGPR